MEDRKPVLYFFAACGVFTMLAFIVLLLTTFFKYQHPLEVTSQPELIGQYDITGDSYTKRTLQIYRIETNQGEELVATEWRN